MTDVKDTDFKRKRDRGVLVCHPMTSAKYAGGPASFVGFDSEQVDITPPPWYATSYRHTGYTPILRCVPSTEYSSWATMTISKALGYCNGEINNAAWVDKASVLHTELSSRLSEGIASTLVTAAESAKTFRMIRKAVSLLRTPLEDAREELKIARRLLLRQDWRGSFYRKKVLDRANDAWLEGRYGWRPFIYDVIGHVEATRKVATERRTVKDGFVVKQTNRAVDLAPIKLALSGSEIRVTPVRNETYTRYVSCGQTADYAGWVNPNLRKYGVYDLVGAAWDLVPLSFVYDWFVNIGDILRSLQTYALVDERVGWTTLKDTMLYNYTCRLDSAGPIQNEWWRITATQFYLPEWTETFEAKQRFVVSDFKPFLGLRNELDPAKVLDLAALAKQLLVKRANFRTHVDTRGMH